MECKKVKFANEKFADDYIKKLKKTSVRSTVPIRAYLCMTCNTWHLTSREKFEHVTIKELNKQISDLKNLIKKIQNQERINRDIETNKDSRVIALSKKMTEKSKKVRALQNDNHDLIYKNLQLTNKIILLTNQLQSLEVIH